MEIKPFIYGDNYIELSANTYLVIDGKDCVLVDPGKEDPKIVEFIKENSLNLKGILLTHGHFDHMRGIIAFECPVYIHKNDVELLNNPHLNCSDRFSRKNVSIDITPIEVEEGTEINLLSKPIKVIHTPYHTLGSVCYYIPEEKILFSGDTLFKDAMGRSDFVTSDPSLIKPSLAKLGALPDDVILYPGHGDLTSIGYERKQNPFVKR